MDGILLIDKPSGFTSFDVIAKLRGILKIRRLGHSGTLDPMATGVLPVFVGKATKCCDMLPCDEKSYTAGFMLGKTTDTQDITGRIIAKSDKAVTRECIEKSLEYFRGEINQLPPMFSAVSVNGKRLYDLARQGIEVERAPRKIRIDEIRLLDYNENTREGTLFIKCSKGTYIRTIIHDLGSELDCGGIMTSLVRNSSSGYLLKDCLSIDNVQKLCDENRIEDFILPIESAFIAYGKVTLSEKQTFMYKNGVRLDINRIKMKKGDTLYRAYSSENIFLGIGKADYDVEEFSPFKNFF